jgi:hypothetical protein
MAAIGNRECPFRVGYAMLHETWDGESDVHGRGTRCGQEPPVAIAVIRPFERLLPIMQRTVMLGTARRKG